MRTSITHIRKLIAEALDKFRAKQSVNLFVYQAISDATDMDPEEVMLEIMDDDRLHRAISDLGIAIAYAVDRIEKSGGKSGFYSRAMVKDEFEDEEAKTAVD